MKRLGNNVIIVFDGYLTNNTKDQTHQKRYLMQSLRINISLLMKNDCNKGLFLSNCENKQQFNNMLGESLLLAGHRVIFHDNDADVAIVDQALALHDDDKVVRVICDDTDVFIVLLSRLRLSASIQSSVYLLQPKSKRTLNMTTLNSILPEQVRDSLLVIHAMTGCDTTSFLFGIGKSKLYKKSTKKNYLINSLLHMRIRTR